MSPLLMLLIVFGLWRLDMFGQGALGYVEEWMEIATDAIMTDEMDEVDMTMEALRMPSSLCSYGTSLKVPLYSLAGMTDTPFGVERKTQWVNACRLDTVPWECGDGEGHLEEEEWTGRMFVLRIERYFVEGVFKVILAVWCMFLFVHA
ncbi:hypothetical protein F5J12DRAFT_784212 [Pisolithus orientalis]|uniref:uncharacterized protein n=1 Tax=Pisolithus orientalis TaxID=936130 RepID=UPI0022252D51|nr:uncharacterized protein F5J12DRAFT_784212 [Pisolithus orientalis]KAI6000962.1 hypothetical protein F5J12DRAFT_784212 [Pisolithus orientalis]